MKKGTVILLLQIAILKLPAQVPTHPNLPAASQGGSSSYTVKSDSAPKVYLGFAVGVNNYVGIIGLGVAVRIYKPLLVRAGLGIGSWGTKFTGGLQYELRPGRSGWTFGIGYSYCAGLKNFQESLQVDTGSTTVMKEVPLNLNPASTINITAAYSWVFHKRDKFYLETGYAVANQTNPYVVENGDVLSPVSQESLSIISPGGLIVAAGLLIGF